MALSVVGAPLGGALGLDGGPLSQDCGVQSRVALTRCHESEAAVTIWLIIPGEALGAPRLGVGETFESAGGNSAAREGEEERLDLGVIIPH